MGEKNGEMMKLRITRHFTNGALLVIISKPPFSGQGVDDCECKSGLAAGKRGFVTEWTKTRRQEG